MLAELRGVLEAKYLPMAIAFSLPEIRLHPIMVEIVMAAVAESNDIAKTFMSKTLVAQVVCLIRLALEISVTYYASASIEVIASLSDLLPMRMSEDVFVIIDHCPIG